MAQPTSQPQSPSQPQSRTFAPAPDFHSLSEFIQAAASGNRDSLFHLVAAIVATVKSALACLCQHFKSHPRLLTLDKLARIKFCAVRLQAIFHTLAHAPERFFTPAQLRALTRAQAVLAHIWRQPVDFSPLTPILTAPETCPPPPRSILLGARASTPAPDLCPPSSSSSAAPSESESSPVPAASLSALPSSDPLLLRSPGCALASVLLHIAAFYGLSISPRSAFRAPRSSSPVPSTDPHTSPHSAFRAPRSSSPDPSPDPFTDPPTSPHSSSSSSAPP